MLLEESVFFLAAVLHIFVYCLTQYYPLDVKPGAFEVSKECKGKKTRMNENKLFYGYIAHRILAVFMVTGLKHSTHPGQDPFFNCSRVIHSASPWK